ncbi:MAG: hypothetical protein ACO1RT_07185 [Planctomycetaceae bacterium]
MRTMTLAVGIVAVGTLAALPFRRLEVPTDPDAPVSVATGPLARQLQSDSFDNTAPWPHRAGFDSSLAWQPQPMTLDALPPAFELPPMPEQYTLEEIEVPMPAVVRDRFPAAVAPVETAPGGLLMPQVAQIEDRFVYTPLLEAESPARPAATIQAASAVTTQSSSPAPPVGRQYIREPQ